MRKMRRRRRKRAGRGPLPAQQVASAQSHEVHLAGASRTYRGEKHLVISFTEELESLSSLVHEDAVQVTGLHRADLDGLLTPTHDLVRPNVGH